MLGRELLTALRVTLVLVLVGGVGYPAVLYGLAHAAFPWQAETSLLRDRCGVVVGSALVGQQFTGARWFHGRPSAVGYNGVGSGGSNLGPSHPALADSLNARAALFRADNGLAAMTPLPVDAIAASGSGLDPDVSLETAELQIPRVAAARRADVAQVRTLVRAHSQRAWLGNGRRRINVLALNLALDSLSGASTPCAPAP